MIDLYKPHFEISRTTSEITLLVFRAGLENAANFLPLFLERIFALGSKMRRIFSLCFSEITLETSRNDAQIFERNFVESSQGQRTKFAHFALITFSQYCIYIHSTLKVVHSSLSLSLSLYIYIYIDNSLHLARKHAQIFVRRHYLFQEANSFLREKLEENCELPDFRTDFASVKRICLGIKYNISVKGKHTFLIVWIQVVDTIYKQLTIKNVHSV